MAGSRGVMTTVAAASRIAEWSVVPSVAVVVAAFELVVAVDLLATASFEVWHNWLAGAVYIVVATGLLAALGPQLVVVLVLGGVGIGLLAQGLLTFEIVRLPGIDWERRLAERRLGRKL